MVAKRHRRWFSFGLRGLLLTVAVAAIALTAWLRPYRQQALAAAQFRALGALVQTADGGPAWCRRCFGSKRFQEVITVEFPLPNDSSFVRPIQDEDLAGLVYLRKLHTLKLSKCEITDAALANLPRGGKMIVVYLDGTGVTDAGICHFARLDELYILVLNDCEISDSGLEQLASMPRLKIGSLSLSGTQISDRGLGYLQTLPKLHSLDLDRTAITNQGLELAMSFPKLHHIDLEDTKVTDDEIDRQCLLHPRKWIEPDKQTRLMNAIGELTRKWLEEHEPRGCIVHGPFFEISAPRPLLKPRSRSESPPRATTTPP